MCLHLRFFRSLVVILLNQKIVKHSSTGEGNGNPLECSCLENPRDGSLVGCRLWGRTEPDTTDVT